MIQPKIKDVQGGEKARFRSKTAVFFIKNPSNLPKKMRIFKQFMKIR